MGEKLDQYICIACGEAENCDAKCIVETWATKPTFCPISGDECEWESRS